jgi:hypothetical protein
MGFPNSSIYLRLIYDAIFCYNAISWSVKLTCGAPVFILPKKGHKEGEEIYLKG